MFFFKIFFNSIIAPQHFYTSFPTVGGNALLLVVFGIHDGFTGFFFVLFSFL
jgi:hypothetical protein